MYTHQYPKLIQFLIQESNLPPTKLFNSFHFPCIYLLFPAFIYLWPQFYISGFHENKNGKCWLLLRFVAFWRYAQVISRDANHQPFRLASLPTGTNCATHIGAPCVCKHLNTSDKVLNSEILG